MTSVFPVQPCGPSALPEDIFDRCHISSKCSKGKKEKKCKKEDCGCKVIRIRTNCPTGAGGVGPTGPTGEPGPTGPAGTGAGGVSSVFAAQTVSPQPAGFGAGTILLFPNEPGVTNPDFVDQSTVLIPETGVYQFHVGLGFSTIQPAQNLLVLVELFNPATLTVHASTFKAVTTVLSTVDAEAYDNLEVSRILSLSAGEEVAVRITRRDSQTETSLVVDPLVSVFEGFRLE